MAERPDRIPRGRPAVWKRGGASVGRLLENGSGEARIADSYHRGMRGSVFWALGHT
jgi:hypothetical protein